MNELITEDTVFFGIAPESNTEAITILGNKMRSLGYVTEDYTDFALEREKKYPTGLPLLNYGVAIPHTEAEYVIQEKIAVAKLKNPVSFRVMGGSEDKTVQVDLIFMLCIKKGDRQLTLLQNLMDLLSKEEQMDELMNSQNKSDLFEQCKKYLKE
jgi:PTS system galactitol-specific IIA component